MIRSAWASGLVAVLLAAVGTPASAGAAPPVNVVPLGLARGETIESVAPCAAGGVWIRAAGSSGGVRMVHVGADASVTRLPAITKRVEFSPLTSAACYDGAIWLRDPARAGTLLRATTAGYQRFRLGPSARQHIGAIHGLPDGGAYVLTQSPGAGGSVRVVRLTASGQVTTLVSFARRTALEVVAESGFLDGADGRLWLPLVEPRPGEHGQWSPDRRTRFVLIEGDGRTRRFNARALGVWSFAGPDATGTLWYTVFEGGGVETVGTVSPGGRFSRRRVRSADPLLKASGGLAAQSTSDASSGAITNTFVWQGTLVPRLTPAGPRWEKAPVPWSVPELARAAGTLRSQTDGSGTPTVDWEGRQWWVGNYPHNDLHWLTADGVHHRLRIPGGPGGSVTIDASGNPWVPSADGRSIVRVTLPSSP